MLPWPEKSPHFLGVLDNIRSLHNVGAIFRTADGAGMGGLILSGITGTPPRSEIRKAALGAEEAIPWRYTPTTLAALEWLEEQGYYVVALEKTGTSKLLYKIELRRPLALVIGNEFHGIQPEILQHVDVTAHLPMRGVKTSLNVSVAFGIAAYEISRRFEQ